MPISINSKISVAVFVSHNESNLSVLLEAQESGKLKNAKIDLVISCSNDALSLTPATADGIPTYIIPCDCFGNKETEKNVMRLLDEQKIGLVILDGFYFESGCALHRRFRNRIIAVQPSLMPAFYEEDLQRIKVQEAVLQYGAKVTGATVYYVGALPSENRIILQKAISIRNGDTPESLSHRIRVSAEWSILPRAVEIAACEILQK